jgi:hypothetical protein
VEGPRAIRAGSKKEAVPSRTARAKMDVGEEGMTNEGGTADAAGADEAAEADDASPRFPARLGPGGG